MPSRAAYLGAVLLAALPGASLAQQPLDSGYTRQIRALTGTRRPARGSGIVVAPMPGLVVRVEVAAGQRVDAGAGLVVVEAMKMENELRAPRAAVVAAVHVAPGQAVEKGAPLVTLESVEPSS